MCAGIVGLNFRARPRTLRTDALLCCLGARNVFRRRREFTMRPAQPSSTPRRRTETVGLGRRRARFPQQTLLTRTQPRLFLVDSANECDVHQSRANECFGFDS